jgi:hypothetical protein
MKIKKGKSFAIYVSSKVNDNVVDFLNTQKNVSEFIISVVEEYINTIEPDNVRSLSRRVAVLEEIVLGNSDTKTPVKVVSHVDSKKQYEEEVIKEADDIELLFKQLNE